MVNVEEPAPLIEVGLKLAVVPEGNPLALRPMLPLKPFKAELDTVYLALEPATTVTVFGVTCRVKSGARSVKLTFWV